jgi:hypothetical protein
MILDYFYFYFIIKQIFTTWDMDKWTEKIDRNTKNFIDIFGTEVQTIRSSPAPSHQTMIWTA